MLRKKPSKDGGLLFQMITDKFSVGGSEGRLQKAYRAGQNTRTVITHSSIHPYTHPSPNHSPSLTPIHPPIGDPPTHSFIHPLIHPLIYHPLIYSSNYPSTIYPTIYSTIYPPLVKKINECRCGPSELTNWHLVHGRPSTETGPMGHQQLCHLHLKHRKKPGFPPAHS